jgi:hypothetical protein
MTRQAADRSLPSFFLRFRRWAQLNPTCNISRSWESSLSQPLHQALHSNKHHTNTRLTHHWRIKSERFGSYNLR